MNRHSHKKACHNSDKHIPEELLHGVNLLSESVPHERQNSLNSVPRPERTTKPRRFASAGLLLVYCLRRSPRNHTPRPVAEFMSPRSPKWHRIRAVRRDSRSKRKAGACHVLRPLPSEGRASGCGGMRPPGSPVGGNISASRDGGGAGGGHSGRRDNGGDGRSGC